MDPRFAVNDPPRPVPPGIEAETPLVTLAWRALHAEHRRAERETARLQEALAVVADDHETIGARGRRQHRRAGDREWLDASVLDQHPRVVETADR